MSYRFVDSFQAGPWWRSIRVLLESCMIYIIAECTVNNVLMMDRRTCLKHVEFHDKINFIIIKPTRCTNFTNLFWHETLCVSDKFLCPSSGVYSLYTQQCYMSYRFVDSFRAGPWWSSILFLLESCMTYIIAERKVNKLLMMDRRTCPKHVEFHDKINL